MEKELETTITNHENVVDTKASRTKFIGKINSLPLVSLKKSTQISCATFVNKAKLKVNFSSKELASVKLGVDKFWVHLELLNLIEIIYKKSKPTRTAINISQDYRNIYFWIEVKKEDFSSIKALNNIFSKQNKNMNSIGVNLNNIIVEDFFDFKVPNEYKIINYNH